LVVQDLLPGNGVSPANLPFYALAQRYKFNEESQDFETVQVVTHFYFSKEKVYHGI